PSANATAIVINAARMVNVDKSKPARTLIATTTTNRAATNAKRAAVAQPRRHARANGVTEGRVIADNCTAPLSVCFYIPGQRENRQVHRDQHHAHHATDPHHHDRLQHAGERRYRDIGFFLVEVGDLVQHLVQRASLFAYTNHLHDHVRKHAGFDQGLGHILAFAHLAAHHHNAFFNDHVAGRACANFEGVEDRNTRLHERAQGTSETRYGDLLEHRSHDGQLEQKRVEVP